VRITLNSRTRFVLVALAILIAVSADPALAQVAQRPFAVAGREGGGEATGITGWLLSQQSALNHMMTASVKALRSDGSAVWGLFGLSFAYGVLHATGPGHGKALIASYVLANERVLRRRIVLAFLAAILQAFIAIALVSVAALLFNATSAQRNRAANLVELASYLGIAAIGDWLVWSKGNALARAIRLVQVNRSGVASGSLFRPRNGGPCWPPAAPRSFAWRRRTPAPELRADMCTRLIRRCLARDSLGAPRRPPSLRPAHAPVPAQSRF
jgi:nickel/cobalt transporter (NicO) family protein